MDRFVKLQTTYFLAFYGLQELDRFPICRLHGSQLAVAVGLLHAAAFSLGYFLCKGLKFDEKTSRTVSIETGIPGAMDPGHCARPKSCALWISLVTILE